MKYSFSLLLLFILIIPCRAQKYKPVLNLAKDSTYYLVSAGTTAMDQSFNGLGNSINFTLSFKMAFKVVSISDSLYHLDARYQSLGMKIHIGDTTIDMDSKKGNSKDALSAIAAAMMNKPFDIILTRRGKVKSVENIEKMISGVVDGAERIDPAKKEQIKSQLIQSFGASAFKGILETGVAIFPGTAVGKNDKWISNTVTLLPARANVQTAYRLMETAGDCYRVHGDGILTAGKDTAPVNGIPSKYELYGSVVTDVKVNKTTGWIYEVKVKQLMAGNIEIQDNPKTPGGMTVPMTFKREEVSTDR